jgi:hypothetical protein
MQENIQMQQKGQIRNVVRYLNKVNLKSFNKTKEL